MLPYLQLRYRSYRHFSFSLNTCILCKLLRYLSCITQYMHFGQTFSAKNINIKLNKCKCFSKPGFSSKIAGSRNLVLPAPILICDRLRGGNILGDPRTFLHPFTQSDLRIQAKLQDAVSQMELKCRTLKCRYKLRVLSHPECCPCTLSRSRYETISSTACESEVFVLK